MDSHAKNAVNVKEGQDKSMEQQVSKQRTEDILKKGNIEAFAVCKLFILFRTVYLNIKLISFSKLF